MRIRWTLVTSRCTPLPGGRMCCPLHARRTSSTRSTVAASPSQAKEPLRPSPEKLEDAIRAATNVLKIFKESLNNAASVTDVSYWAERIKRLETASPSRTVIGVLGRTGAGKSSIINALIGQERLVPTSGSRACTASVTEISYNDSDDAAELFRAEVDFFSVGEWCEIVKKRLDDIRNAPGLSRDRDAPDVVAGQSLLFVKTVYPNMTKKGIAGASVQDLLDSRSLGGILGGTVKVRDRTAAGLYAQLQRFVDGNSDAAQDRYPAEEHGSANSAGTGTELWPMVKTVRIYTKAHALATGTVVVDLPGSDDSNTARSDVAVKYMSSCTGFWIIAPISRAVDDKSAKTLLGRAFRHQLKLDGFYTADFVTFICSKTDDISITEALDSPKLRSWFDGVKATEAALNQELSSLQGQVGLLRAKHGHLVDDSDRINDLVYSLTGLAERIENGEAVFAAGEIWARLPDKFLEPAGNEPLEPEHKISRDGAGTEPLTHSKLSKMRGCLKGQRDDCKRQMQLIECRIVDLEDQIARRLEQSETLASNVQHRCIQDRNACSRAAIQQDFVLGIKDLDGDAFELSDADDSDPIPDYDGIAASLPVFCVSARAFQQLSGNLKADSFDTKGFRTLDDTAIPQLQAHTRRLSEANRAKHARRFLADFHSLEESLRIWADDDGTKPLLLAEEQNAELDALAEDLERLRKGFGEAIVECVNKFKISLDKKIYRPCSSLALAASKASLDTADSWGRKPDQGGFGWSTYRAACTRNGKFSSPTQGNIDFTFDLSSPMERPLLRHWECVFTKNLPSSLGAAAASWERHMVTFRDSVMERLSRCRIKPVGINALAIRIKDRMRETRAMPDTITKDVNGAQRRCNRAFDRVITRAMEPGYQRCAQQHGTGSFSRAREAMHGHIELSRHSMFTDATGELRHGLERLVQGLEENMTALAEGSLNKLQKDVEALILGEQGSSCTDTKKEITARIKVLETLLAAKMRFRIPTMEDEGA